MERPQIRQKAHLIVFLSACCGTLQRVGIYSSDANGLTVDRRVQIPLEVYAFEGNSYQEARDKMVNWILSTESVYLMGPKIREMCLKHDEIVPQY